MAEQLILPRRVIDANGDPLSGAKLYAYIEGTTTLEAIYTASDLLTAHPSPLVSDSGGNFPPIWHAADHGVKLAIFDASDVEISWSPLDPCPATSSATTAENISFTPIAGNAATDVQAAIQIATEAANSDVVIASGAIVSGSVAEIVVDIPTEFEKVELDTFGFLPVVTDDSLMVQVGTGSAASPTWQTTYAQTFNAVTGSSLSGSTSSTTSLAVVGQSDSVAGYCQIGRAVFEGFNRSGQLAYLADTYSTNSTPERQLVKYGGGQEGNSTRTVLRILASTGNIKDLVYTIKGKRS